MLLKKIEQIAFSTCDIDYSKRQYEPLGITQWESDIVTAKGTLHTYSQYGEEGTREIINVARLEFNYDMEVELELIQYLAGDNWHNFQGRKGMFQSHMSYHVEDMPSEVQRLKSAGLRVIQEVKTLSHTNPYLLKTGRKYHYVIFDSRNQLGFDLKLIKRIEKDDQ